MTSTLYQLARSSSFFSCFVEKIATTRLLAINVKLRAGDWSRKGASDIDGLSREAEMSGSEWVKAFGGWVVPWECAWNGRV